MNNLSPQLNAVAETFSALRSGAHGLGLVEAKERLKKIGPNVLPETRSVGWFLIFLHQFQSPLIYILLAAGSAIYFIGEVADAAIIGAVLFFNSIAGAFQEGRAQNTLRALKKFSETKATVLREGKEYIISDREIVPGDVIILNEGEKIPADARIIFSGNLKVDEAALTGESEPVHKIAGDELGAGEENKNIIYKGTHVVFGSGRALVFATGVSTKVGKIAKEIAGIDTEIPLKANIRHLSRLVILSVTLISVFLFIFGIFAGHPIKEMFTTIVTLSVSVIPEGLPVVMTLVLATGVWRMSKSNALVKRLQAVEALGQARVLALDKTGTLTKNEMVIEKVFTGNFYNVSGTGYEPKGDVVWDGNIIDPANHEDLLFAGKIAALCANARVVYSEEEKRWNITGDPTEAAMIVFANKLGFHKNELLNESPLLDELPFDYRLKYHATYHKLEPQNILSVVGAPEIILKKSSKILRGGKSYLLTAEEKENLEQIFFSMSKEGLRVVAFAESKEAKVPLSPEKIEDLTFAGFFGMKDALREEAAQAIARAKSAGMKIVIITGDHKATAEAIAREAGIWEDGDKILTGEEIENLSENDLAESITNVSLFARVTPEHKLSIIKAFKKSGDVVAMTGDGVNDAPSLVAADLGVAMGKIGTEVAKEASDIILLDDNFGNIISAIEEGRSIYKTIKKVILYLFSTSWGEVFTIVGALFLGYPLPILPAQIIWLNFVTDGFLDVALAMEPKEKGLLNGNFERPKKYLIDKLMAWRMVLMATPMMIGTLYLFGNYFLTDINKAWTITLTTLAVFQWFNAWNCRSEDKSIFKMNLFSNKFLVAATFLIIILQMLAVYNPYFQQILHTSPLSFKEWLMILPVAFSIILLEEVRKFFFRKYDIKLT